MNTQQKQFYDFILERVQNTRQDDAKSLLIESFNRQEDGTFNIEYLQDFNLQIIAMLKSEYVDEVKSVMMNFDNKKY